MKKEKTEEEAFLQLAALCANAEHCQYEMLEKMKRWELSDRKVQQGLWMKRIDKEIQDEVLDDIDEKEYLDVLKPLLKQKRKSIKANSDYELNQKLVRFAYGRGFTFDIIRQCLDVSDIDEDEFEDDED